jgi:hypothetical protein
VHSLDRAPTRDETRGLLCAAFTDPQGRGEPRWRPEPLNKTWIQIEKKALGETLTISGGIGSTVVAVLGDHTIHTNQSQ